MNCGVMPNEKVYIHEFIEIRGAARAKYMHHMTANWGPIAQEERNQLCFGCWGTVGSTGRWPEVVNMWEEEGWEGLAANFAHETGHAGLQDPSLKAWWQQAAEFRRGGFDRILVPAEWSPTIAELIDSGVQGNFYAHERVDLRAGTAVEFLGRVRDDATRAYEAFGLRMVGAFRTAMRADDEAIVIWAIPSDAEWAAFEAAHGTDAGLAAWHRSIDGLATGWHRTLLVDAPTAPLRLRRQPAVEDRRPLDEI